MIFSLPIFHRRNNTVSRAICWAVVTGWAGFSYSDARFWKTSAPLRKRRGPHPPGREACNPCDYV